jgi:hypothetical protein
MPLQLLLKCVCCIMGCISTPLSVAARSQAAFARLHHAYRYSFILHPQLHPLLRIAGSCLT